MIATQQIGLSQIDAKDQQAIDAAMSAIQDFDAETASMKERQIKAYIVKLVGLYESAKKEGNPGTLRKDGGERFQGGSNVVFESEI